MDAIFTQKLLACVRQMLRFAPCPECKMDCTGGGLHGVSQINVSQQCHLGALMDEAETKPGIYERHLTAQETNADKIWI